MVFQNKKKQITYLDVSIPNDQNVQTKYNGKIIKYTYLAMKMGRIWEQEKVEK